MVMILVFLEHLFTKANINPMQAKPTVRLLRRTVIEGFKAENMKVMSLSIAWPSCPRSQVH